MRALFFNANDGATGPELWQSDSTTAGTVLSRDINSGASGSNPVDLSNVARRPHPTPPEVA